MPTPPFPAVPRRPLPLAAGLATLVGAVAAAVAGAAHAARADRNEPMSIDSDSTKGSVVDLNNHSAVFIGNVVIRQGTLIIQAGRLELREEPDGRKVGVAIGTADRPASFRQRSDRPDEWTEGEAQRIEYDSDANRVRFVGSAHLRVLRNDQVTNEGRAAVISYDTQAETITFDGKPAVGTASAPGDGAGRTHVVFQPPQLRARPASGAAPSAASSAASAAGDAR